MKWDRTTLAFGQFGLRERGLILGFVFDHGKLQRQSNLRRGQSDSWSIAQGLLHVLDQLARRSTPYFILRERTCLGSKDNFSDSGDFDTRRLAHHG